MSDPIDGPVEILIQRLDPDLPLPAYAHVPYVAAPGLCGFSETPSRSGRAQLASSNGGLRNAANSGNAGRVRENWTRM